MGVRARRRLRDWAGELVREHGRAVAGVIGVGPPLPDIEIDVTVDGPPGVTAGSRMTFSELWFRQHPDDAGCVLHELSHAYLRAPEYSDRTAWLIEGIADHTRDVLGFDAAWTFAHYEPGKATAGYQTTAHFLGWLEASHPGAVVALARKLSAGSYEERSFVEAAGASLADLTARYESEQTA